MTRFHCFTSNIKIGFWTKLNGTYFSFPTEVWYFFVQKLFTIFTVQAVHVLLKGIIYWKRKTVGRRENDRESLVNNKQMMPVTEFDIRQGLTYSHQPTSQTARQPHLFSEVRQNFFFIRNVRWKATFCFPR